MGIKFTQATGTQLATGVYTGDGNATQVITGLNFAPRGVMIYRQATSTIGLRTTGDTAAWFSVIPAASFSYGTQISGLTAGGFTVSNVFVAGENGLNNSTSLYSFMAWG